MAVEFSADTSIEQLGDEMAKAMGERDPKTVKSIVQVCGVEKAIALFEEMRTVESQGGMMIDNGRRRRTPGGVFISLFKLDADIPGDVKKRLFDETKMEARKILRARKKGRSDFAQDVAKVNRQVSFAFQVLFQYICVLEEKQWLLVRSNPFFFHSAIKYNLNISS
ncbi:hypothetical protein ANCCAN_10099 [Ancylostoma caninum]|uniref:Phosphorylated adapter RNA export protein n=1 Tax=Ancylostoma caninum TaxID=29170 RepID=A0A368GJP2_ANCCA|nr:hypothetical protein ANCCAN_10099 [Ancylostoma caninum]